MDEKMYHKMYLTDYPVKDNFRLNQTGGSYEMFYYVPRP